METNECKHQYPRTMEKVRVCVLCGHAEETNELPEGKDIIKFLLGESDFGGLWYGDRHPTEQGAFWWRKHLRLALQSKEEEVKDLKYLIAARDEKIAIDALSMKQLNANNLDLAMDCQDKDEQLKAKDEEIANLKRIVIEYKILWNPIDEYVRPKQEVKIGDSISVKALEMIKERDSLTSEVERLKKERESRAEHKRLNDEIAQLTKPKDELTKEVERLRELLGKAKLVIENGNDWSERNEEEANKLYTEICDLLSQSTDKP